MALAVRNLPYARGLPQLVSVVKGGREGGREEAKEGWHLFRFQISMIFFSSRK